MNRSNRTEARRRTIILLQFRAAKSIFLRCRPLATGCQLSLLAMLLLSTAISARTESKKVVLDADLSAGRPKFGVVSGGKFVKDGWTPVNPTDSIRWTMAPVPIRKGYITIEFTNFNPYKQTKFAKNQFFVFLDHDNPVISHPITMRMSTHLTPFNVEVKERDGTDDDWREWRVNVEESEFDLKRTHTLTISWDEKPGFKILFDGKERFTHPNNRTLNPVTIKGLHQLIIGDEWTKGASPGPVYKRVTCVSLDSTPAPKPTKSLWREIKRNNWEQQIAVSRVMASDEVSVWPAERFFASNIVDGNVMGSRWLAQMLNQPWILFDLGSAKDIQGFRASFNAYKKNTYIYSIAVSDDNRRWRVLGKNLESSRTQWTEERFPLTKARYVKLTLHRSDTGVKMGGLWEAQILSR
jgi:hypothetical protein